MTPTLVEPSSPDVVVVSEEALPEELGLRIQGIADRWRAAQKDVCAAIEVMVELGDALLAAKRVFPATRDYGGWLDANGCRDLDKDNRSALISIAECREKHPARAKAFLDTWHSISPRWTWSSLRTYVEINIDPPAGLKSDELAATANSQCCEVEEPLPDDMLTLLKKSGQDEIILMGRRRWPAPSGREDDYTYDEIAAVRDAFRDYETGIRGWSRSDAIRSNLLRQIEHFAEEHLDGEGQRTMVRFMRTLRELLSEYQNAHGPAPEAGGDTADVI